jgi:O-antigen ligase
MTTMLGPVAAGYVPASGAARAVAAPRVNGLVRGALYVYILSIPFEIPHRSFPVEVPTITGALFLATTLLSPGACYRRIPQAAVWFLLHVWILVALAIAFAVGDLGPALQQISLFLQVILLCITIYNVLADPRVFRGAIVALIVATAARAAVQVTGVAATRAAEWGGGERVTAFGQNANLSAMILSAGLVAVLGIRVLKSHRLPRPGLLVWPVAALLGMALIQTGSRGGLLCALVGLVTFWFAPDQRLSRRIRNGVLGLLAGGALAWGALQDTAMRNRLANAGEGNLAGREIIYPGAIEMIEERPLLGWGPVANQFELSRRLHLDTRKYPSRDVHNLLLELLSTSGVFGTIPFLIGLGLCVRGGWRARRGPAGLIPLAMLLAVLTGTLSGTWIISKILWLVLPIALAAGAHWSAPPEPAERRAG